jgi:hypothetical protein
MPIHKEISRNGLGMCSMGCCVLSRVGFYQDYSTLAMSRMSKWLGLVMIIQRLRKSANIAKHSRIENASHIPLGVCYYKTLDMKLEGAGTRECDAIRGLGWDGMGWDAHT